MATRRQAIHLDGLRHGPGRPAGSRIGNLVISASLVGVDPESGTISDDPAVQMQELFLTMRRFLDAAGMTIDDVIRVNITVSATEFRELLNEHWLAVFDDESSLPARIVTVSPLGGAIVAELDLIAFGSE